MIVSGFTLAVLTTVGFFMVYRKLPRRVRRFMEKNVLLTDALACLLTYALFGGTLVALFAAAWAGILVSAMLALASDPRCVKVFESIAGKLSSSKEKLVEFIASFNNENENKPPELKVI